MTNQQNKQIRIAVVGDVHDQWEPEDAIALEKLQVDLVLFVGDFGNESVEVVEQIAKLTINKAVILGNHDAWYTASEWGRRKAPYDHAKEDRVQQQLDLLGVNHVGYNYLDFPELDLSVVGSRPFSWGGPDWRNQDFYQQRFTVSNFAESEQKILAAAEKTKCSNLVFLGHNGPLGLGNQPESICGRDWYPLGGDYGDPDLRAAITKINENSSKKVVLVAFGHMHHYLRHHQGKLRVIISQSQTGTIYLNAARVPRIVSLGSEKIRNFSLVELEKGIISKISLVWMGSDYTIREEELLYASPKLI